MHQHLIHKATNDGQAKFICDALSQIGITDTTFENNGPNVFANTKRKTYPLYQHERVGLIITGIELAIKLQGDQQ